MKINFIVLNVEKLKTVYFVKIQHRYKCPNKGKEYCQKGGKTKRKHKTRVTLTKKSKKIVKNPFVVVVNCIE